ncbi:hypothetical protein FNV43_RR11380 [Rhamnella rubrinervis]|uniref:Uncharacterized protein n=1 Tax=Rhamnella rubrinervis TaxID=2594499 RepID=A0A8K0H5P5_9ROSA|nr:hypothetical protein FNV43_RR11380 [Rhamnella rubrinervis]
MAIQAQLDWSARDDRYRDDDTSEEEDDGAVLAHSYGEVDELLRTNEDLVVFKRQCRIVACPSLNAQDLTGAF